MTVYIPPTGGFISLCCFIGRYMSALIAAYREYLDRMFDESDDLVGVDMFTVPSDVDVDSPMLAEWADIG